MLTEMEQTRPFSGEQNRRGEEASAAYWYSLQLILMDTDSHREMERGLKTDRKGEGERKSNKGHIFHFSPKADPTSPPPNCVPQLPV